MNKLFRYIFIFLTLFYSKQLFCTTATAGFTGIIDLPTAYTLRPNNFNVAGIIDKIDDDTNVGVVLQTGFVPQLEAGLKITTNETEINSQLLKANLKFQFVKEANNPAFAVGFVESDEGLSLEGDNPIKQAYGYLVASKKLNNFFIKKDIPITLSLGMTYDEADNLNGFTGMEIPLYTNINFIFEVFSYQEIETANEKTKISLNLGGEFFTNEKVVTKVFWRERNETFGISIAYIGIYK